MATNILDDLLTPDAQQAIVVSAPQDRLNIGQMLSDLVINYQSISSHNMTNSALYAQDFYAWTQTTAALLRIGKQDEIDWHTLAEEIESMGASQYDAVSSAVYQILIHLLKWRYQPERQNRSWRASLVEHRNRIPRKLRRSPSLAPQLPLMVSEEYAGACRKASAETGLPLDTFPTSCPWTEEQVRDHDFFPEASNS